ncbi:MAG TPA: SgcJ/EcaC family oxidoreductase [Candidatus Acidoferrales bacterium]
MPRTRLILPAVIFAMTFTTSCYRANEKDAQAQRQQEMQQARAADEAAIRAASAAWSKAATAKDLDKAVSFYADDALILPDKAPALRGDENIRKNWAPLLALPGPGLSWQTSALQVARSGELAYETGAYVFVTTDKKGISTDYKGKYLVIWKKQSDGSWKVAVDTDNSDQ